MANQASHKKSKTMQDYAADTISQPIALRAPSEVMRLKRLGSFFPHRLSFMRILMRALCAERPQLKITSQQLDENGYGHMVLSLQLKGLDLSLIAYSRALDPTERTDRVIATKWDASFCLYLGVPDRQEIAALATHVTAQEAGRYHEKILTLSRANKSVRLFDHVTTSLAKGEVPDRKIISQIGYLMRTTAVYGNGKFGIADRKKIAEIGLFEPPFQAEMLTVFLIREYSFLLAEWCAKQKNPDAITLDQATKRNLGIGNSTGLGMAPFLVNHPCLIHSWILAREVALQRARSIIHPSAKQMKMFYSLLHRATDHIQRWHVEDVEQTERNTVLAGELAQFIADINQTHLAEKYPLEDAYARTLSCSEDMQELMVSIIIEICPEEIDGLAHCLSNPFQPKLEPSMQLSQLRELIVENYSWALDINLEDTNSEAQFWYVSEAKLEPRLGKRFEEEGADREMPFHLVRYTQELIRCIDDEPATLSIAAFMLRYPHTRYMIRRVQTISHFRYGEIRDNLVDVHCRPIDLLRCKLSFFGASHFDPKSDRWTRVTLFQGAPTAKQIAEDGNDDWLFAPLH